jgi:hypothetical protein
MPRSSRSSAASVLRSVGLRRILLYQALECGKEKSAIYVIYGLPPGYTKMLDPHVKSWAEQQLLKLPKNYLMKPNPLR